MSLNQINPYSIVCKTTKIQAMETVVAPGKRIYMPTVNHLGFTQRISIGMKIGTVELIEIVNPKKGNGILVVSEKLDNDPVVSSVIVNIMNEAGIE